jgi:hypothetical protein
VLLKRRRSFLLHEAQVFRTHAGRDAADLVNDERDGLRQPYRFGVRSKSDETACLAGQEEVALRREMDEVGVLASESTALW